MSCPLVGAPRLGCPLSRSSGEICYRRAEQRKSTLLMASVWFSARRSPPVRRQSGEISTVAGGMSTHAVADAKTPNHPLFSGMHSRPRAIVRKHQCVALFFGLVAACGPSVNPETVDFGTRTYRVRLDPAGNCTIWLSSGDDVLELKGMPSDRRHLAPCPRPALLVHDLDGDGLSDLGFYSCGILSMYMNQPVRLSEMKPVDTKLKEGRWLWIDAQAYPGLHSLLPAIRRVDPDA